jgi:hypothetical protein
MTNITNECKVKCKNKDKCHLIIPDIENKKIERKKLIVKICKSLTKAGVIDLNKFDLSSNFLTKCIEHYYQDLMAMKCRYNIKKEVQLHGIAGLTAGAILRYRPIIEKKGAKIENDQDMYVNEHLAIFVGLAICGGYNLEKTSLLFKDKNKIQWFKDFLYLLHFRNYTPESLSFIFLSFGIGNFPNMLKETEKF